MASAHSLQRGLPGYLILFAPHAFVLKRQELPRRPLSPLVFLPISTHFTATPGIPSPPTALESNSIEWPLPVKPGVLTFDLKDRLRTLYAQ